jgi:phthiocerol/phenolphthiocerol synthesis type-I polyketide synthase E
LGHAVELRVCRSSSGLHLDWWYDTRRVESSTVQALAEHLPDALTGLLHEALAGSDTTGDIAMEELALVDLSAD